MNKEDLAYALIQLDGGDYNRYDAPYEWWNASSMDRDEWPPEPDWCVRAARGIVYELVGRRPYRGNLPSANLIAEADRGELIETLAQIIRAAASTAHFEDSGELLDKVIDLIKGKSR